MSLKVQLSAHFAEFAPSNHFECSHLLLNLTRLYSSLGSHSELEFCNRETFCCANAYWSGPAPAGAFAFLLRCPRTLNCWLFFFLDGCSAKGSPYETSAVCRKKED